MRILGLLLITTFILIPLYWFIEMMQQWDTMPLISQYFGIVALIIMAIIQLLATRMKWLETVFGGLDRIYVLHKWMGISALAFVMLHETIDPEVDGVNGSWLSDLAETLGENSLTALQVLLAITIITIIPYHWWRWSHKLMGALYVLAVGHLVWIDKPFANTDPLGLYTLAFCIMGILCYLYTLLPAQWFKGYRDFKVTSVERTGDATSISLTPIGKGISYSAGQFAFIKFEHKELTELHPFTISQAPQKNQELRFTIKDLGDYTRRLPSCVEVGLQAKVQGGFGHFRLRQDKKASVWVAAGIGITPFLAWANELKQSAPQSNKQHKIHLFYCIRNKSSAPHLEEIIALANSIDILELHIIDSSERQRLSSSDIINAADDVWPKVRVAFCGPQKMRESLYKDLTKAGLRSSAFQFEEFEIRSGIGLEKLLSWAWPKLQPWFLRLWNRSTS